MPMATDVTERKDVSLSTGLKRILRTKENPLEFVKDLVQRGEHNTGDIEAIVQQIVEETDGNIKKAVYQNYQLFIEAAKEVALLEAEMQVMSSMLKDQRHLLEVLTDFRLTDLVGAEGKPRTDSSASAASAGAPATASSTAAASETDSRKALSYILERVEGSSDVADVPNRSMLHHGDCTEVSPAGLHPIGEFHLFLLNDCVLLASVGGPDASSRKMTLLELIELDNVSFSAVASRQDIDRFHQTAPAAFSASPEGAAVSNGGGGGAGSSGAAQFANLIKMRVFPETRVFSVNSSDEAAGWIEKVRAAKLAKAILDSGKRQPSHLVAGRPGSASPASPSSAPAPRSLEDEEAAWFEDKPDDLDVLIAERRFEKAVDLLLECYKRLEARPQMRVLKGRIDLRKGAVIRLLIGELQIPPHVSLRGGPKSSRKAVRELVRLGKAAEAAEHFLHLRSSIRQHLVDNVKLEDSQALYAKRIAAAFFKTLVESLKEFSLAGFGRDANSALLRWCRHEIEQLAERLHRVLAPASFAEFASGWAAAKQAAKSVNDSERVQAAFMLEAACLEAWQAAIERQARKLIDAASSRAAEEKWVVLRRGTRKEAEEFLAFVRQFSPEATERSLGQTRQFDISSMTYVFSNSFVKFAESLAKLYTRELHYTVSDALASLLSAEIKHYRRCLSAAQLLDKRDFILHNLTFLQSCPLQACNTRLSGVSGCQPQEFDTFWEAQQELGRLIEMSKPSMV
ncbi:hypothetical protein BOX15_Mlig026178g1 [Macrostomum lignano]|uniref:Exocyst component Exo84 C-terminal domain-containing protein n=1 Tax=Macrostomum lignano TaxID=282301 RepID=A0A267FF98_9PLAT|nr:hypothetical protein BOX15_Mlig026178g1 [Macrostomum lignano]